jgi:hypothetical protein
MGYRRTSNKNKVRYILFINAPYKIGDRTNQCAWCVPQKSIAGAVEVALGNAPYKISVLLRSAFGIALN